MILGKSIFAMAIAAALYAASMAAAVSSKSNQSAGSPQEFHWNWHDSQAFRDDDALRGAKLEKDDRRAIADAIEVQLRPILRELGKTLAVEVREAALETRVRMVDLNNGGSPEVFAEAVDSCSPVGNCSIWIFKKSPRGYELILSSVGQTFTIQATSTNGFRDIVIAMHGSATESSLKEYRYRDEKYQRASCHVAAWEPSEGQTSAKLEEPKITPCSDHQE